MINALRSEWIKLTTVTSTWILVAIGIVFPLLIVTLTAALAEDIPDGEDLAELLAGTSIVSALILGALATVGAATEFAHNTIRPTFAAMPDRWRPMLAKAAAHVGVTVGVMSLVVVVGWLAGSVIAEGEQNLTGDVQQPTLVGVVLLGVGLTVLGYALGLLLRNTALALCILLLWPLLAEGLIAGLFAVAGWDGAQKWLPYQAGFNMAAPRPGDDSLGRVGGGLWFFTCVLTITALALWSGKRRDA